MSNRVGFMQGRLSPVVDGRIQAFPWSCWREEFELAEQHGFHLMEWTLDHDGLYENPLLTLSGQGEIRQLRQRHGLAIPSLTADCFMQAPLWKASAQDRKALERDFQAVARACSAVDISIMVVPLVDNGRIDSAEQEDDLVAFLQSQSHFLATHGLRVVFESDFSPMDLARFIGRFDPVVFGINYDIGNSAALGFDPVEELAAYGHRVLNVHVKDRVRGGATVPLGTGHANFAAVFTALDRAGYAGNYILQTARAQDGAHADVLCRYRKMAAHWLNPYAA